MNNNIFQRILPLKLLIAGTLLGLAAGCSSEQTEEPIRVTEGTVVATFSVTMPEPEEEQAESRAESVADTDILTADGLIFDENGRFIERLPAASCIRDGEQINITLLFDATPKKRIIHLVANSRVLSTNADRVDFSPLTLGCAESQVAELSTIPVDESTGDVQSQIMPPVMWGRLELSSGITKNMAVSGIKLLRSLAAVTVRTATATPANGLSDFELIGAALSQAAKAGYVTPSTAVNTAPSSTPTVQRALAGVSGTVTSAWVSEGAVPVVYCYERTCTTADYMGVIVKARYKGDVCYYKVLMLNSAGQPYNIIRNHRYILTITEVTARGYADIQTASEALPCNTLKASVVEADGLYSSSVADQQYLMSLDCNTFELYGRFSTSDNTGNIKIATIKSTHPVAPTVRPSEDFGWLKNFRVSSTGSNTYELTADFIGEAENHIHHEGMITVVSDNLELPLKIMWHRKSDVETLGTGCYSVNVLNAGETNWYVKVIGGQTVMPWFGLTNSPTPQVVTSSANFYLDEINSRFNPGAWVHVNTGTNNQARLHKSCAGANGEPISSEILVVRHE